MTNLPQATGDTAQDMQGPVSRRALVAGLADATAAATVAPRAALPGRWAGGW